jgi:hypothetical protein
VEPDEAVQSGLNQYTIAGSVGCWEWPTAVSDDPVGKLIRSRDKLHGVTHEGGQGDGTVFEIRL